VGTIALAIFALVQIAVERRARRHHEHLSQAELVSVWPRSYWGDPAQTVIVLHNGSDQPVYRTIVSFVFVQGSGPHSGKDLVANPTLFNQFVRTFPVIPPGRHYTSVPSGWTGMMPRPGVELGFVDRAGVSWLRTADGRLSEPKREPVEYYGIPLPVGWDIPEDSLPRSEPVEPLQTDQEQAAHPRDTIWRRIRRRATLPARLL
jgi:hypothetical protein